MSDKPQLQPVNITFPDELPVSARRADIEAALSANQVVIICGETGSGKTTQLPKICLNMGRGAKHANGQQRTIGHTQPRRVAATSTAKRIAQELHSELGDVVGYKIRFQDKSHRHTAIKLMTDGILLAETQTDPLLRQYDTLIIDEAHERSLNIDFLLGFLRQLLPKRPDLKVIVTSATIDADRFAKHFSSADGKPAPVIEVSGRMYPVEVRYRPILDPRLKKQAAEKKPPENDNNDIEFDEADLNAAIVDAVDELCREGSGDVLVFLPGEREIREAAEALRKHHPPHVDILPLFARLSAAEQDRIFSIGNARRIVLATNVAETSLTVPGIRYVIDSGLARVKRYSYRNKVEQLHIEPIAQASANQRAGRCGRVSAGICVRLYSEEDFNARPRFMDPEILRSSLAGVILKMKSLGLGDVAAFPFVEPPPGRAIADGQQLLAELNAVNDEGELTTIGAQLVKIPADPRVGRMILAARERDCLSELLIIASGLSVQDPRDRPMTAQEAADNAHKRFADERSDFMAYLKMWSYYEEQVAHKKSNSKLHASLKEQFLSPLRLREWREVHSQLLSIVGEQGWRLNTIAANYEAIHCALLTGLLGNIGFKAETENIYQGARSIKFHIHPGSALARKGGRWIMAGELVDTSRLFARCVAKIEPEWLERVGVHLLRKSYHDPHWEKKQAQVTAYERATLYGLIVYSHKRIHYGRIDLSAARELFIREALVAGNWDSRASFFLHNRSLIAEVQQLEHRARRQDVLVDDELIFAFYDQHIPADVCTGEGIERWAKEHPKALYLTRDELMRKQAGGVTTDYYPKFAHHHSVQFALSYHFEPGSPRDGATMTVPISALNQVDANRCDWLVPGMLKEKVSLLLKSLPQKLRRHCVPLPDYASAFYERHQDIAQQTRPLVECLRDDITANTPARPGISDFRIETLPPHCFMNFKLIDEHGRQLDMQRTLAKLRAEWGKEAQAKFQAIVTEATTTVAVKAMQGSVNTPAKNAGDTIKRSKNASDNNAITIKTDEEYTAWTFADLPELLEVHRKGQTLIGYPALVDTGTACRIDVFDEQDAAQQAHLGGLRRLFAIALKDQIKFIEKNLPDFQQCALLYVGLGSADELKAQWLSITIQRSCLSNPLPTDAQAFEQRVKDAKGRINLIAQEVGRITLTILTEWTQLQKKCVAMKKAFPAAVADIEQQVSWLLPKQFLLAKPWAQLAHYPRYLKAALVRLEKLRNDPPKDAERLRELQALQSNWQRAVSQMKGHTDARLEEFAWQLQELRVSLFAQELKTPMPVSAKRLQKAWDMMRQGL